METGWDAGEHEGCGKDTERTVNSIKIEPAACTTAKPTMQLRWVPKSMMQAADLKLQQAWEIVHYNGAQPTKLETEWRDVPISRSR